MEQVMKLDDKVKEHLDKLKVANVDFDLGGGRRLKGHARNHCGCGDDDDDVEGILVAYSCAAYGSSSEVLWCGTAFLCVIP